jgi:hypothetical protein
VERYGNHNQFFQKWKKLEEKTQEFCVFTTQNGNVSIIFNKRLTKCGEYGTIKYRKKPPERQLERLYKAEKGWFSTHEYYSRGFPACQVE